MTILYSVVSRGTTILAKHAACAGNFSVVTEQILLKIPDRDAKMTYSHGNYLFHYVRANGIIYYAITEDDYERSRAFQYLGEIKKKFQTNYGDLAQTALPYAMNNDFSIVLNVQMQKFSRQPEQSPESNKVEEVRGQLDELKEIMVQNIDSLAERGENLNLLIDKTDDLSSSTVTFKKTSTSLARKLYWKNVKFTIIASIIVIIIVYIIVTASCGGFTLPTCVKHGNGTKAP